jgi:hypothetical protein
MLPAFRSKLSSRLFGDSEDLAACNEVQLVNHQAGQLANDFTT